MGGFFTDKRAYDLNTTKEWIMPVPDASMADALQSTSFGEVSDNSKTLQEGSPALYALVSDTSSPENKWLPSIMPDGRYCHHTER